MAEFFDISLDQIEAIKELWEKNRIYHEKNSEHFKAMYRNLVFEQRMEGFKSYDGDHLKITIAKKEGCCVGYCISTIETEKGELASLHVEESQRGSGIGRMLAERHLRWMEEKNCTTIGVVVSPENNGAIGFYERLGLFPNALYMQNKR